VIFLHVLKPLQVFGTLHVEETGAAPDHEDLADFFFDGKLVERFLGPLVVVGELQGSGWLGLVFLLGEGGQGQRHGKKYCRKDSRHAGTITEGKGIGLVGTAALGRPSG
jgi:hypothetical protein